MTEINRKLGTNKEKAAFIAECENQFENRLDEVCTELVKDGARIIALSGPTCSGKTTTARKLTEELTSHGASVHFISIDDFFHEREVLDQQVSTDKGIDYDSVKAIDLELLAARAASIMKGDATELPIYDFMTGKRDKTRMLEPDDHSVFIFEGIQAIYPEVTALFGDSYRSVYISVEDDLELNDVYFGKRDLRLLRRLVRDYRFRGAHPEFSFMLWRSVAANEDVSILPYVDTVDLRINSIMPYEPCLMRSELIPVLELVSCGSIYYPKALEIIEKLKRLDLITPEMIPENSLLREFIG